MGNNSNQILECLRDAQKVEREYLSTYEQPCEPLAYETLRTFDDIFCRDLMEPLRTPGKIEQSFRSFSTWGVNHALKRILPTALTDEPFRDFPSIEENRSKADDFIFHCGLLAMSERLEGWLEDGIVTGEFGLKPGVPSKIEHVLVIKSALHSYLDEEIGMAGLRWASDLVWQEDREKELNLEARHREIHPELERHVVLQNNWRIAYSTTRGIDDYFLEWAKLYLRRMFSQDMLGPDDKIGGRPFSQYLEVLTALSARSQKHIAFAAILRERHSSAHLRNLLTTYCPSSLFVDSLAAFLNADSLEVQTILESFILSNTNLETHTKSSEITWAPIVQASKKMLILPIYGLDINPFLFLLTDLRHRHESDWFRAANNRERRWLDEMSEMFTDPRWKTNRRNLRLREDGKDMTDIDFAAYDHNTNELALFQLKWQHPVGLDNRGRRSTGKNLLEQGNRWINAVMLWLERNGIEQLMQRLTFPYGRQPKVFFFVIGRYHVHFSGFQHHDDRSAWSDWAHFRRTWIESSGSLSAAQLFSRLQENIQKSRSKKQGESTMFPIGNIAVVVNPTSEPKI